MRASVDTGIARAQPAKAVLHLMTECITISSLHNSILPTVTMACASMLNSDALFWHNMPVPRIQRGPPFGSLLMSMTHAWVKPASILWVVYALEEGLEQCQNH